MYICTYIMYIITANKLDYKDSNYRVAMVGIDH